MTSAKNLQQPAYNSFQNQWNIPVNANFGNIDDALGNASHAQVFTMSSASGTIGVTGTVWVGNYPANTASYIPLFWSVTGSLSDNTALQIPTGVGGRWLINVTSLTIPAGKLLTFVSAGGGSVPLNYGLNDIVCDGSNVWLQSTPPGAFLPFGGAYAPAGYLLSYGQSLAVASYPYLYAAIGYAYGGSGANFNAPDLRGRALAGLDNMGGVAAGRLTNFAATAVGAAGGEQNHTLITNELAVHTHIDQGHYHTDSGHSHTDGGHIHGVSDPQHAHSYVTGAGQANPPGGGAVGGAPTYGYTNPAYTGISIQTGYASIATGHAIIQQGFAAIQNAGGGAGHNNVQPTMAINWAIKF